jgi:hypothetical protein
MAVNNQWVLYAGRTLEVVALVKQNNVPMVCVMVGPKTPKLIPLAQAVSAPVRSSPRLVVDNTGRM